MSSNKIVEKPWGSYSCIDGSESCYQVKKIVINPNSMISLQSHKQRSEHWIILEGTIICYIGGDKFELKKNQSMYIPKNVIHRLENNTSFQSSLIEVQIGEYLGEDDIIRYEDIYGRN